MNSDECFYLSWMNPPLKVHFSLWSIMRAYPLPGCVFIC